MLKEKRREAGNRALCKAEKRKDAKVIILRKVHRCGQEVVRGVRSETGKRETQDVGASHRCQAKCFWTEGQKFML